MMMIELFGIEKYADSLGILNFTRGLSAMLGVWLSGKYKNIQLCEHMWYWSSRKSCVVLLQQYLVTEPDKAQSEWECIILHTENSL